MAIHQFFAIDPWALILPPDVYVRLRTLVDPPPEPALLAEAKRSLGPEEKQFALARARHLAAYFKTIEDGLSQG